MLTISPVAAVQLDTLLRKLTREDGAVIRMVRRNRRFHLRLDAVHGGDVVFNYHGRAVLVLDDWVSRLLNAGTLDVHKVNGRPKLSLHRRGIVESLG